MRPSEQIGQVEEDSHEYASREGHEQPLSPSPSLSGSYEYDDDDDQEEQEHDVKGDAPLAEQPIAGPSTTAPNIPAPPPQKPKRTRQLTTPHQAAVLHALLAQSRFPTTAMREDVGRQIGLSARKVQVWFQNQRQKARKGAKEAQTSATTIAAAPSTSGSGPSHYIQRPGLTQSQLTLSGSGYSEGPLAGRPSSARGGAESIRDQQGISHSPGYSAYPLIAERHEQPTPSIRRHSRTSLDDLATVRLPSTAVATSSDVPLTGPGVPGAAVAPGGDSFSPSMPAHSHASISHPPLSPEHRIRLPPVNEVTPSRGRSGAVPFEPERFHDDPQTIRLPPLQLYHSHQPRELTTERTPTLQNPFDHPYRAQLPSAVDIPSRVSTSAISPSSLSPPLIPPPFTLEPSPVWQPSRTAAVPPIRPLSSAGSSSIPSGTGTRSQSSDSNKGALRRLSEGGEMPMFEGRILPAPRSTRFDPVRNTVAETSTFSPESRRTYSHSSDDDL